MEAEGSQMSLRARLLNTLTTIPAYTYLLISGISGTNFLDEI